MISSLHAVNIFGLDENLCTVRQNICSDYKTGLVIKVFENGLWRSLVFEEFHGTGYSFIKNWISLQDFFNYF